MLSIQQHIVLATKRGETPATENVVIQHESSPSTWKDYSRCTRAQAIMFLEFKKSDQSRWRAVDWITGEQLNISNISPESIIAEINKSNPWNIKFDSFNLRDELYAVHAVTGMARAALDDENEGDLKKHIADLSRRVSDISKFVEGM